MQKECGCFTAPEKIDCPLASCGFIPASGSSRASLRHHDESLTILCPNGPSGHRLQRIGLSVTREMTTGKTIVVIDDEHILRATLTAVLERNGYQVHVAPNASQGRKKIEEFKPDLVLLDLGLPDADGLDVLRQLKAAFPMLPVMILTAHDTIANAIESIKLGAFHFLSK